MPVARTSHTLRDGILARIGQGEDNAAIVGGIASNFMGWILGKGMLVTRGLF